MAPAAEAVETKKVPEKEKGLDKKGENVKDKDSKKKEEEELVSTKLYLLIFSGGKIKIAFFT